MMLVSDMAKMGFKIKRQLQAYLRSKSIIVRHFSQTRIDQYLRITIGTDEQCQQFAQTLDEYLRPSQ